MILVALGLLCFIWLGYSPLLRFKYRHIPGFAGLPFLGNLLMIQDLSWHNVHNLGRHIFGPVFKMWLGTSPRIVVADAETCRQVLTKCPFRYEMDSPMPDELCDMLRNGLLFAHNLQLHKKLRRIWAPAFSPSSLEGYHAMMVQAVDELVEVLEGAAKAGRSVDAWTIAGKMTMNVVGSTGFGLQLDCLNEEKAMNAGKEVDQDSANNIGQRLVRGYSTLLAFGRPSSSTVWLPLFLMFPGFQKQIRSMAQALPDKSLSMVKNAQGAIQQVCLELVDAEKSALDASGKLSTDELVANVFTFLAAGAETTANTLGHTIYLLTCNPEAEATLVKEIEAFGNDRIPTCNELSSSEVLSYLEAVLNESLRLLGPAPMVFRQAETDMTLCSKGKEYAIPAGTKFEVSLFSTMLDPEEWREPEQFRPERFIKGSGWYKEGGHAWMPFGGGSRMCVGKTFAVVELKLALFRLYQRLTFQLEPGVAPLKVVTGMTMGPDVGIPIRVHLQA
eukprot:gene14333-20323_t